MWHSIGYKWRYHMAIVAFLLLASGPVWSCGCKGELVTMVWATGCRKSATGPCYLLSCLHGCAEGISYLLEPYRGYLLACSPCYLWLLCSLRVHYYLFCCSVRHTPLSPVRSHHWELAMLCVQALKFPAFPSIHFELPFLCSSAESHSHLPSGPVVSCWEV